jgi:hypothetical protein
VCYQNPQLQQPAVQMTSQVMNIFVFLSWGLCIWSFLLHFQVLTFVVTIFLWPAVSLLYIYTFSLTSFFGIYLDPFCLASARCQVPTEFMPAACRPVPPDSTGKAIFKKSLDFLFLKLH